MESWLIFHVASKKIDRQKLWKIWRKSTPDIDKWAKILKEQLPEVPSEVRTLIDKLTKELKKITDDNYSNTIRKIQKWAADPNYCTEVSRKGRGFFWMSWIMQGRESLPGPLLIIWQSL